jgi:two-component sensor histidine kinase
MSEETPQRDLDWYRSQWAALTDLLSASEPEAVVEEVRRLQERVETLSTLRETLAESGIDDPEQAAQMIDNMADQLEELYAERDRWGEPRFERTSEPEERGGDE